MTQASSKETRNFERHSLLKPIAANNGVPNRGGVLQDLSLGGAAIVYPEDVDVVDRPLKIGEVLPVNIGGASSIPSRVVRIFNGGFAIKFDFSIDMRPYQSTNA